MKLEQAEAVSSVVGTVLLLAITMVVFSGVAIVVLDAVDEAPTRGRSDISVVEGDGIYVRHLGGEALSAADLRILVTVDGAEEELDDDQMAALVGDSWRIGQTHCISCIFAGQSVERVQVIHGQVMLLQYGEPASGSSGGSGGGSGGGFQPDLLIDSVSAAPMVAGDPVQFDATVRNAGDATGGSHTVLFEITDVDSMAIVHTSAVAASGLAPQGNEVISDTWTASQGNFTISVTADNADQVAESDETNNTWTSGTFTPASPGSNAAYEDNDGDGQFTPGTDSTIEIGTLEASDCGDGDCAAGDLGYVSSEPGTGLVVEPGAGPITTSGSQDIYFEADGDVGVGADMEGTGSDNIGVKSTSGNVSLDGQSVTNGQGDIVIEAAGDVDLSGATLQTNGNTGTITVIAGGDVIMSDAQVITNGNNGGVSITAGGNIVADGATAQGKNVVFTADGAGSIDQSALSLLDKNSSPHGGATNSNLSCLIGTLTQGTWNQVATTC